MTHVVRACKLINQEEIIFTVVGDVGVQTKITNPLALRVVNGPNGPGLAMTPWTFIGDEDATYTLHAHACVTEPYPVSKEAEASYLSQTTGIAVAPTKSIITG